MLSQLGALFKTTLRQTEQADARLQIRREEKENQGKKRDFEENEDTGNALWEDSTEVSVSALRTFLIEFLKSHGDETREEQVIEPENTSIMSMLEPEHREPASGRAAQAVKAYSSMQSKNYEKTFRSPAEPAKREEETDLGSLLKADELRTMHLLIAELDRLSAKGVQTLMIEKADTFLEALVAAVRLEKEKT